MKCPLRIFVVRCGEETGTGYMPDCLKEECAWWDEEDYQCELSSFIPPFMSIAHSLHDIASKTPLGGK